MCGKKIVTIKEPFAAIACCGGESVVAISCGRCDDSCIVLNITDSWLLPGADSHQLRVALDSGTITSQQLINPGQSTHMDSRSDPAAHTAEGVTCTRSFVELARFRNTIPPDSLPHRLVIQVRASQGCSHPGGVSSCGAFLDSQKLLSSVPLDLPSMTTQLRRHLQA